MHDVRSETARRRGRLRAASDRRREPAFGMGERYEQLLHRAPRLAQRPGRLLELVLAELDGKRADHRHRYQRRARQRLLRGCPRLQVVREGLGADIGANSVLPNPDRVGIVLTGPAAQVHGGS